MKPVVLTLALLLTPLPALAHKVIAGVFPAGTAIEGEIGFSSGEMAAGAEVIVTGPDGAELGRTTTDADGFFTFVPEVGAAHTFRADLGAGHVAEVTMPAEDVAALLGQEAPSAPTATPAADGPVSAGALSVAEKTAIAEAVRAEIRPLRREITAYKERTNIQSILGGLGYIAGLFGLGFYLAARRRFPD